MAVSNTELYLPVGDQNNSYVLQLIAEIRDMYGAVTAFNLSLVTVRT